MKKLVSAKLAGNILLVSFGLFSIFHILVLIGIVPSNIVWGGQIGDSPANLQTLESISLILTLLFMLTVAVKMGYLLAGRFKTAASIGVWIIFAYLMLNTVGNLASAVSVENLIFTPITLFMAFMALRLAIEK